VFTSDLVTLVDESHMFPNKITKDIAKRHCRWFLGQQPPHRDGYPLKLSIFTDCNDARGPATIHGGLCRRGAIARGD